MRKITVTLITLVIFSMLFTWIILPVKAETTTGPYVDQLTFFATTDESKALGDVSAGLTDAYLGVFPLPSEKMHEQTQMSNW